MIDLIKKIEEYNFECESGHLKNCQEWQKLKEGIDELPYEFIIEHQSDCATKNAPALPNKKCDCGATEKIKLFKNVLCLINLQLESFHNKGFKAGYKNKEIEIEV